MFSGFAATSDHSDTGNGANTLCLPSEPEFRPDVVAGLHDRASKITSVEFEPESDFFRDKSLNNHDMTCALCQTARNDVIMVPARRTCPQGWHVEYEGLLMADWKTGHRSEYVCVSLDVEAIAGTRRNRDAGRWWVVEVTCVEGLPCDVYPEGYELSCVVCSK